MLLCWYALQGELVPGSFPSTQVASANTQVTDLKSEMLTGSSVLNVKKNLPYFVKVLTELKYQLCRGEQAQKEENVGNGRGLLALRESKADFNGLWFRN